MEVEVEGPLRRIEAEDLSDGSEAMRLARVTLEAVKRLCKFCSVFRSGCDGFGSR